MERLRKRKKKVIDFLFFYSKWKPWCVKNPVMLPKGWICGESFIVCNAFYTSGFAYTSLLMHLNRTSVSTLHNLLLMLHII